MILLCIDHWADVDDGVPGFEYSMVEFNHVLVVSPGENYPNQDDACFGMCHWESFKRLKGGIAYHLSVDVDDLSLFWEGNQLNDEDNPDTVGMEMVFLHDEFLEIHIRSKQIET